MSGKDSESPFGMPTGGPAPGSQAATATAPSSFSEAEPAEPAKPEADPSSLFGAPGSGGGSAAAAEAPPKKKEVVFGEPVEAGAARPGADAQFGSPDEIASTREVKAAPKAEVVFGAPVKDAVAEPEADAQFGSPAGGRGAVTEEAPSKAQVGFGAPKGGPVAPAAEAAFGAPTGGTAVAEAPASSESPFPAPVAGGTGGGAEILQQVTAAPMRNESESCGLATGSLVLGLGTLLTGFLSGIPAVITGHMARRKIKESGGRLTGSGRATAGLIMGYLSIAAIPLIAIVAAIAIPNIANIHEAAQEAMVQRQAQELVSVYNSSLEAGAIYQDLNGDGYLRIEEIIIQLGHGVPGGGAFEKTVFSVPGIDPSLFPEILKNTHIEPDGRLHFVPPIPEAPSASRG